MNLLFVSDLESLLDKRPGPCISIYLPTSPPGARTPQGPIRLRNLLGRASAELFAHGLHDSAIETLLGPLEDLLDDVSFWNTQEQGIALFRAPGFTRAFHLPRAFAESCEVGDHFFLKPLLPLIASDDTFYVLALSQNAVRLLEANGRAVRRLALRDLPRDLADALGEQTTAKNLQYHTASSAPAGAQPPIYHGRGGDEGAAKEELRRYLRQVEAATRRLLAGRTVPLVLAGAAPLPALYRQISSYPHLAAPVLAGNPDLLTDEELRDRAWQILEPTVQELRRRAVERFGELAGTGRASSDVTEILPAARHGRVAALFLACDADLWGRLDRTEEVLLHAAREEGDEELLDAAALFSLRHGGAVYGMERGAVPGGGDLAAVFRY